MTEEQIKQKAYDKIDCIKADINEGGCLFFSFSTVEKLLIEFATEATKELQEENRNLLEGCEGATMMYKDLVQAKKIIESLIDSVKQLDLNSVFIPTRVKVAEQFLKG